jgi:hypothetical protein
MQQQLTAALWLRNNNGSDVAVLQSLSLRLVATAHCIMPLLQVTVTATLQLLGHTFQLPLTVQNVQFQV